MATAAQISAKYEISFTTVIKAGCDWANMVFGQQWTADPEFDEKVDDEEEDILEVPDSEKKTRQVQQDLTYRFPSRQTLSLWLKDAAILNLKYLGEHIFNKDEAKIVTWGTDDTVKKAGNKLFDAKTSHITIAGENMTRQTFTTGFDPNISHTGEHSAFSIDTKFKMLSVLTNQKSEDLKADIDFWMGDRADDVTKAMEILGIESKKVLRCSAHITCGADNAVDKVFKHFESTIGVHNLISLSDIQSAFIKSNSVFIMAINAISKLLSYSHATLPYSLCVV